LLILLILLILAFHRDLYFFCHCNDEFGPLGLFV
jgi:hypothetical protein